MGRISDEERGIGAGSRAVREAAGQDLGEFPPLNRPVVTEPYEQMRQRLNEAARLDRARGYAIQEAGLTEWERTTATGRGSSYTPIFEDASDVLLGWHRSSGHYEEIRDRLGNIVWSDEIGLEIPVISPIDLIGPGIIRVGGRIGLRFVSLLVARLGARYAARSVGRAVGEGLAARILLSLRNVVQRVLSRAAVRQPVAQLARDEVNEVQRLFRRVIVNLGGRGEVRGAINVNTLADQQVSGIPHLILARAEEIGNLFPPRSVDMVVSREMVYGQCNWLEAARGAIRILKNNGTIEIIPYGQNVGHLQEIESALTRAGFRNVELFDSTLTTTNITRAIGVRAVRP
jgi:hypothetical protein